MFSNFEKSGKRVAFDQSRDSVIPNDVEHDHLSDESRKLLWYTREELKPSCREAKNIIRIINSLGGNFDAIDQNRFCTVGLEKFHNVEEKEKCRRFMIRSILKRQDLNRTLGIHHGDHSLREISETLSESFREFALWQGTMHVYQAYGMLVEASISVVDHRITHVQAKRQRLIAGLD